MANEEENGKIMAVAEKYSDYFNEWHSDIALVSLCQSCHARIHAERDDRWNKH